MPPRKLHLAIAVANIPDSIATYSEKLGAEPIVIVPNEYALWRTDTINLSIRQTSDQPGTIRHLGWEDPTAIAFTSETDCNGILWEHFAAQQQADEINELWPGTDYQPD
jgi:catechol 2,3-dioxygenase-like lactoylglutathione lyase family enzyme